MGSAGLHPGLETQLAALAARIAALKEKRRTATGSERLEELGEIEELERRQKALADGLRSLDGEGPGFRQDVKAELERMAHDLTASLEDFVMRTDSRFAPERGPKEPQRP